MSVSVKTLLELPILQDNSSLLTDVGIDNIVQYVTVMEASSIHFSSFGKGVLVLTTLSAYHDSLEKVNSVIRGLCEVGVAAIGIKIGRFIDKVDPSTVQIAINHNVPIIIFSSNVYFREILNEMLSVITGNQRQTLNQINNLNRAMVNAIAENRTIQDLLHLLCQELECYCCCYNSSMKTIAERSSLKQKFDQSELLNDIEKFFNIYPNQCSPYYQSKNVFIFPCIVQDHLRAAFCVLPQDPLSDLIYPLSQSITSCIDIKLLEQDLKVQAERRVVSSMLDDILFSRRSDAKATIERLQFLNFTPRKNFLIILLSNPAIDTQRINWLYIEDSMQQIFSEKFQSALVFKRGNKCVALVSYDSNAITAKLPMILSSCLSLLVDAGQKQFYIGCSMPTADLATMSECYLQAKKAIQFGVIANPDKYIYLYSDYFELGLLSYSTASNEASIFFDRIVIPVLRYDKQFRTNLWVTLETAFAHDKLDEAASALHIHISTLRYRLQKIEDLTEYSFFNFHERLILYLAYLLYKVSDKTEH